MVANWNEERYNYCFFFILSVNPQIHDVITSDESFDSWLFDFSVAWLFGESSFLRMKTLRVFFPPTCINEGWIIIHNNELKFKQARIFTDISRVTFSDFVISFQECEYSLIIALPSTGTSKMLYRTHTHARTPNLGQRVIKISTKSCALLWRCKENNSNRCGMPEGMLLYTFLGGLRIQFISSNRRHTHTLHSRRVLSLLSLMLYPPSSP